MRGREREVEVEVEPGVLAVACGVACGGDYTRTAGAGCPACASCAPPMEVTVYGPTMCVRGARRACVPYSSLQHLATPRFYCNKRFL